MGNRHLSEEDISELVEVWIPYLRKHLVYAFDNIAGDYDFRKRWAREEIKFGDCIELDSDDEVPGFNGESRMGRLQDVWGEVINLLMDNMNKMEYKISDDFDPADYPRTNFKVVDDELEL